MERAAQTRTITVSIANYDDNQHAPNENLHSQNLWDGARKCTLPQQHFDFSPPENVKKVTSGQPVISSKCQDLPATSRSLSPSDVVCQDTRCTLPYNSVRLPDGFLASWHNSGALFYGAQIV
jgi:hypothetical protein